MPSIPMKHFLSLLIPLGLACCTAQNQLIIDPLYEGESLMVRDEQAILDFEQLMAGIATPDNEYKLPTSSKEFFNSPDVLSTYQDTEPAMGICRNGDKEYYYHIEKTPDGTLITDLDQGVTDYVVSSDTFEKIKEFITAHTPAKQEEVNLQEGLNEQAPETGEENSAEEEAVEDS